MAEGCRRRIRGKSFRVTNDLIQEFKIETIHSRHPFRDANLKNRVWGSVARVAGCWMLDGCFDATMRDAEPRESTAATIYSLEASRNDFIFVYPPIHISYTWFYPGTRKRQAMKKLRAHTPHNHHAQYLLNC